MHKGFKVLVLLIGVVAMVSCVLSLDSGDSSSTTTTELPQYFQDLQGEWGRARYAVVEDGTETYGSTYTTSDIGYSVYIFRNDPSIYYSHYPNYSTPMTFTNHIYSMDSDHIYAWWGDPSDRTFTNKYDYELQTSSRLHMWYESSLTANKYYHNYYDKK